MQKITIEKIRQAIEAGDQVVLDILDRNAYYLSIGINNITSVFNQESLVINSPIYNELPELITLITEKLEGRITNNTHVSASTIGERAIVYGGVALACQNFLNINKLKFV